MPDRQIARQLFRASVISLTLVVTGCSGGSDSNSGGNSIPAPSPPPPAPPPPPPPTPPASVAAFPGAEGFGADASGGRGGAILYVTNTDDAGPGSLRAAIDAAGPRIVIFNTGGTIGLNSPLRIQNPDITIAGQTAPGGGIALTNGGPLGRSAIQVETNNVIIRHLRIRTGPSDPATFPTGTFFLRGLTISTVNAFDVIIDHVSVAWAEDKALVIFGGAHDITVQWSIFAETLFCANHAKTLDPARFGSGSCPSGGISHSRGITISTTPDEGTGPTGDPSPDDISFHHNLVSGHNRRYPNVTSDTLIDIVNNVLFNIGALGANLSPKSPTSQIVRANYIANSVISGPETPAGQFALSSRTDTPFGTIQAFVSGNDVSPDMGGVFPADYASRGFIATARFAAPALTEQPANAARDLVLDQVGATLPVRDSVDLRLIDNVRTQSGVYVNDPSEVGGIPVLSVGAPVIDDDGDGMPNNFETANGFDPNDASDGPEDADNDGFTNVEEYLNATDPRA